MSKSRTHQRALFAAVAASAVLLWVRVSVAAPPHPDLLGRIERGEIAQPHYLSHLDELKARGVDNPGAPYRQSMTRCLSDGPSALAASGQFRALAVLVDFSDNRSAVEAAFFDSLIYDSLGATVRDYYGEVSYGQLDIVTVHRPSDLGWRLAPRPYAYYVNGQNGVGQYPQNTQKLVEDLTDQLDPLVDFSLYDNNRDGYVDVLLVIHAGSGAEFTGSDDDIWSHEWAITPRLKDGVYISTFTIQPEYWTYPGDMTIGVSCHELGHGLGLPDLYDIDYSSNGIGKWCLMGYGSWLGPDNRGESPAHLCAWSKAKVGFLDPTVVHYNQDQVQLRPVAHYPEVYRLWGSGAVGREYFLIENRQKLGYDAYLPGEGLLIWHIDETRPDNAAEWFPGKDSTRHALVALEQADGFFELEHRQGLGDSQDPYPGSGGATSFDALSHPDSYSYTNGLTGVAIENIGQADTIVTADLIVGLSSSQDPTELLPETIALSQNYPNPFNPSTTFNFSTQIAGRATLEVFNSLGQKVATPFDGVVEQGSTTVTWSAVTSSGQPLSSGVYFYRLCLGDAQQVHKMSLVR